VRRGADQQNAAVLAAKPLADLQIKIPTLQACIRLLDEAITRNCVSGVDNGRTASSQGLAVAARPPRSMATKSLGRKVTVVPDCVRLRREIDTTATRI